MLYIIEYAELGTDRAPECFKVYTVCRIAHRQSASVLKYIQYVELLIDSASVFQSINYTVC